MAKIFNRKKKLRIFKKKFQKFQKKGLLKKIAVSHVDRLDMASNMWIIE